MKVDNKLVESVVREVILEYGGVSDEILNLANKIFSEITSDYNSYIYDWRSVDYYMGLDGCDLVKRMPLQFDDNEYVDEVNIRLFGYYSRKTNFNEALNYLKSKGLAGVSYSYSRKMVKLFIPYPIDGNLSDDVKTWLISSLNHEIKHGLQFVKQSQALGKKGRQYAFDKNYDASVSDTNQSEFGDDTGTAEWIKRCYYTLCYDEIDARLQSLYLEYSKYGDLNKCESYKDISYATQMYQMLLMAMIKPELGQRLDYLVRKIFNNRLNAKSFLKLCQRGVNRFNEHMRRIVGRVNIERK